MKSLNKFFVLFFFYFLTISTVHSSGNTVFLDIDYILNNSNLGKSIYLELEKLNTENIKKLSSKEALLKEKKLAIDKIKNVSSKKKIEEDIILFNKDVEKYKLEKKKLLKNFKDKKKKELDNFLIKINPIIQEYMKKNSIDIILEKNQIFIGNSLKDVSKDIINLINKNFTNNG
tara:strand:- start:295 stop:816 length:522 start_codon:yes stop_codon:yes gene_type:complete